MNSIASSDDADADIPREEPRAAHDGDRPSSRRIKIRRSVDSEPPQGTCGHVREEQGRRTGDAAGDGEGWAALTEEQRLGLEVARTLIEHGVPVFIARPALVNGTWDPEGGHRGTGYWFPAGWEKTVADPTVLERWRPGDALCAVMGHGLDALDVDPRHGGDRTVEELPDGVWPRTYGSQRTPSGGFHDLVASLGLPSRDNALVGVDLKAGRDGRGHGFIFIAPTVKLAKDGSGELRSYRWEVPPVLPQARAEADSARRLITLMEESRDRPTLPEPGRGTDGGRPDAQLTSEMRRRAETYLDGLIEREKQEFASAATWEEGHRQTEILLADGTVQAVTDRGWQKLVADLCRRLGSLAQADWTPWSYADAFGVLQEIVPPQIAEAVDLERTWAEQRDRSTPALSPWHGDTVPGDSREQLSGCRSWAPLPWDRVLKEASGGSDIRPTVGRRTDGAALFYPGAVNGLAGLAGAGKSWTAQLSCAQEVLAGRHVVYIDFEDNQAGLLSRLRDLGVPDADLERVHYIRPLDPLDDAHLHDLVELVRTVRPSLVVIDSTGESMAMEGLHPNDDPDTARWFRMLPDRLAEEGPAVLVLDHLPKSEDNWGSPVGSHRKKAAISGVLYAQQIVRPIARDVRGYARLTCLKDRHGWYPPNQAVAELWHDPSRDHGERMQLRPATVGGEDEMAVMKDRVLEALRTATSALSRRALEEVVDGNLKLKRAAIDELVEAGTVETEDGPRRSKLHRLAVKPEAAN